MPSGGAQSSEARASSRSVGAAPDGSAPTPNVRSDAAPPVAVGPVADVPSGLDAVRACLTHWGELRLAPEPEYQAISAKTLATKLGFRRPRKSALGAFCEPELRPDLCAHTDCTVPGLAFTWKPEAASDDYGATGFLIVEEPTGQASAYRIGNVELWEPEFACGCMGGSEFARVTRPAPDLVVVTYLAQTRPRAMCGESTSTSTWFLNEALHPIAAIFTAEPDTGPSAVEVQRSGDEVRVRSPQGCEARVAWSELTEAALREMEQRPSGTRMNLDAPRRARVLSAPTR